jgi:hypothetical protein
MLLGDVIARLEDEVFADETLIAMNDLTLAARVADAAAAEGLPRGEFVAAAVGSFAAACSDEEWLTVIGQMGRAEDPGHVLMRRALDGALRSLVASSGCGGHGGGCNCGSQNG